MSDVIHLMENPDGVMEMLKEMLKETDEETCKMFKMLRCSSFSRC